MIKYMVTGLNFKLDVGLYRLDQQAACQRYRRNLLDANLKDRFTAFVSNGLNGLATAFAVKAPALV
jgi:hypothetical protein